MVAGDTVNVKGGLTYPETVTPAASGTSSKLITYQSWAGTGIPTIDGVTDGFVVTSKNYLTFSGFTIIGCTIGMHLTSATHIIIVNSIINGCTSHGIDVSGTTSYINIYNGTIYGNGGNGINIVVGTGTQIKNTIIANNTGYGVDKVSGSFVDYAFNYNDVYGNGIANYLNLVPDNLELSVDPLFVNPGTDFRLNPGAVTNATYYVAGDTGLDTNDGSQTHPWKTIQKAASTVANGDTVNVKGNLTYSENVNIPHLGSPTIDAGTAISGVTTDILGTSRPKSANSDIGAYEYTPSSTNTYQNWAGTGIPILSISDSHYGFQINNVGTIISGFKFLVNDSAKGIDVNIAIKEPSSTYTFLINNIFIGNGTTTKGINSPANGIDIYNNTFYSLGYGVYFTGKMNGAPYGKVKNNIFMSNNIVGNSAGIDYDNNAETYVTEDYNLFWDNNYNVNGNSPVEGSHDLDYNPLFTDALNNDFTLKSTSPAINSGTTLAEVTSDILNVSRPQSTACDMGAYEFSGVPDSPVFISTPTSTSASASSVGNVPDLLKTIYTAPSGAISGFFNHPNAIAINKTSGMFYVGEDNSNIVVKFDLSGTQYTGFGGGGQNDLGSEDGRFASIDSVTTDGNGNVYVVDSMRNRIQKFDTNGTFVIKWGSYGTGNGQFYNPTGIAVDSTNNIYVVDKYNARIQKFDANGVYSSQWGSYGSGNGQFWNPHAITIDKSDNIYVTDTSLNRIQKFDTNGTYSTQWGSSGSGNSQFSSPQAVITDSSNNVYIFDKGNHRIQKFDTNGTYSTQWGSSGTGNGQFSTSGVGSLTIDSSDNIYASDKGNARIQKFDSNGTFIIAYFSNGTGNGKFSGANGITTDSSNNIYVNDTDNGRIEKFDSNGNFLTKWGSLGTGNGQFISGMGIAVDSSGNVYVGEQGSSRVQKFDSGGNYVTQWGSYGAGNGQFNNPVMVSVDSSDNVYVADSNNHRVQKFDSIGTYITSYALNNAVDGVTFDKQGNMFTSDYGCTVTKFDSSGTFIKSWGKCGIGNSQFYEPTGVATDSYGNVYVLEYASNRIQEFDNNGNFLARWGLPGSANGDFNGPVAITIDSLNRIIIADTNNNRVQIFGDATAPTGSITSSVSATNSLTTLSLSASDNYDSNENLQMQLSENSDFSGSSWEPYASSKLWTFSSNDGNKTIYARFKDRLGNTSSSYSTTMTYDHTAPQITWTDTSGSVKTYQGAGANNVFTTNHFPTFSFTTSSDTTSGISKYQILVNGNFYIDDINPVAPSNSTYRDETDKYTNYTQDTISVYSKRPQDALPNGGYQWKVRAIDTAGNSTDTAEKILRINTLEANFSHRFFPLSLLTIGGKSTTISSLHPELMPTQFTTYSSTPIFYGIAPASTTITLILNNKTYTTTTNSNSRFGLNVTDPLSSGDYPVSLFATNLQGDYVELPSFTLRVGGTTVKPTLPASKPTPGAVRGTSVVATPTPIKHKQCFLWWCW